MKKPILLLLISCLIQVSLSKFNLSYSRVNNEVGSDENVSTAPKSIVTIADLVVSESIGNAYITVSLSQTSSRSIKIYYETIEGTAKVSKDYKYDKGIISISSGKMSAQIIVRIVKDKLVEQSEYFDVKLRLVEDQDHASLGDDRGRVTIEDAQHTSYIELNNLVVVYKNTNYGSIPDDFLARLQPALDEASLFYWRHSHMGLNIKWTIHVIEENLFRVRENDYIYPHEVDADIRSRGFKEGSFDAVLAVAVHSGAYAWGVNTILGRGGFFQVPW